jgi:HSP20 family protein
MALPVRVSREQGAIDPWSQMQREFDSMLGRFFGGGMEEGGRLAPFGVDIREDADHIYVEADMPGFNKEDVDVSLENNTLTINAEKKEEQKRGKQKDGDYLLHERRYERFTRSFTLPSSVDEQTVNARLQNGCLTISINKKEEAKPKKIQVS